MILTHSHDTPATRVYEGKNEHGIMKIWYNRKKLPMPYPTVLEVRVKVRETE